MIKSKLAMIVAVTESGGIGFEGKLPWKLKGDLKNFRNLTVGQVVIMGRGTFESLGKPLDDRINIVVSTTGGVEQKHFANENNTTVHWVYDINTALRLAMAYNTEWVWFIGGTRIFESVQEHVERIALTAVHGNYACDTFIKDFAINREDWRVESTYTVFDNEESFLGRPSHTFYDLRRPFGWAVTKDKHFVDLFSSFFQWREDRDTQDEKANH